MVGYAPAFVDVASTLLAAKMTAIVGGLSSTVSNSTVAVFVASTLSVNITAVPVDFNGRR